MPQSSDGPDEDVVLVPHSFKVRLAAFLSGLDDLPSGSGINAYDGINETDGALSLVIELGEDRHAFSLAELAVVADAVAAVNLPSLAGQMRATIDELTRGQVH